MDAAHSDLIAALVDVLLETYHAEEHAGTRYLILAVDLVAVIVVHVVHEQLQVSAGVSPRCHEHC